MNDSSNYTEYAVLQKAEGKYLVRRVLLIVLYAAVALLYFAFFTYGPIKAVPMICFLPLIIWIMVFFTWRYVSVEHEYTIASGTITFSDVYGGRSRKKKLECKIKDMRIIAPMTDEYKREYANAAAADFRGSVSSPDSYFFIYRKAEGKESAVFFEATAKTLKIMRFYNPSATVMSTALRY